VLRGLDQQAISSNLTIGMDLGDTTCEVWVLEQGRKKRVARSALSR